MRIKMIASFVATILLLVLCSCTNRVHSNYSEELFADTKLFELLKQYQEKQDSLNFDPESEVCLSEVPGFNFDIDFFCVDKNDYVVISGLRGSAFIFSKGIKRQSQMFLGYVSYGNDNYLFYSHYDMKSKTVQEILRSVSFQDPSEFIAENENDWSYIYDPYYVVYKLQCSGDPIFVEEGCNIQLFKRMAQVSSQNTLD